MRKSYWKMGLGVCIALVFNTVGVVYFIVPLFTGPSYIYNFDYYTISMQLAVFPVLVMATFIVLPLIQRQAISIASPLELHDRSAKEIKQFPELKIKREIRVSMILWIILCFFPFFIGLSGNIWRAHYLMGLLFTFTIHANVFYDSMTTLLYGEITNLVALQNTALYSVGNFYFVREIYRFLRTEVTRRRLLLVGIIATFFPLIVRMVFPLGYYYYYYTIIPLPSVFFAGLLIIKLHRPLTGLTDRLWKEDQTRHWWDETDVEKNEEEGAASTPELPYRPQDSIIKVPLYYIIISRIKNLGSKFQK
ncbi:hypothetical protein EU527_02275 [Candidatus Thorarchaeota archaeon]|nr:MAG: hypothetical protein EU527_02275 [Candidatus Thorarchaeota archaeon]